VELIVESVAWHPRSRHPRRRDDKLVAVRITFEETELRERAKRLGAIWRPAQSYGKSPGAMPSVSASPSAFANQTFSKPSIARYMPAYVAIH
jgi:hypothetical protein